jgi:hypothetical protein
MLLALPKNIRLDWKCLPRTNALAYYENFVTHVLKKFYKIGSSSNHFFQSDFFGQEDFRQSLEEKEKKIEDNMSGKLAERKLIE